MPLIWKILETVDYVGLKLMRKLPKRTSRPTANGDSPSGTETASKNAAAARPKLGKPERAAQIFGKRSCLWSGRAKLLLQDRGVDFEYVDLEDEADETLAIELLRDTKQDAVPYVFLRGEFIGGFNALSELDRLGQLENRVLSTSERGKSPLKAKIVVAERPPEGRPPGEA